ncbi:MAG: S8 family serine peptidase [Candidatus Hodarchaeota archaeon]
MLNKSKIILKSRKKTIISIATVLFIGIMLSSIFLATANTQIADVGKKSSEINEEIGATGNDNSLVTDEFQEDINTFSDDIISSSQYGVSEMKIREDNKVEFVVKRDSLEFSPEANQLISEYDVEIHKEHPSINSSIVYISLDSIENFILDAKSTPGIAYAEPNFYDKIDFIPNDPFYGYEDYQWDLPLIGMEIAWDYQLGSHNVLVAVIDTGIDYNHPDLIGNYVPLGHDWVNNDNDPMDDAFDGHGTHVAGTIAASINNGIGIAGMADVSIFAEKSADAEGDTTHLNFRAAVMHAVDSGADIISYSSSGAHSTTKREAIDYAINHGVMVVASAGNEATGSPLYPAAYPEVIAVASTDQNDQRASDSNYGNWIDFSAPGVDIVSTFPENQYALGSGTSMACPHVSGLAALLMSEFTTYTPSQIEDLIRNNVVDLGTPGFDIFYGWGRIDASNIFFIDPQNPILIDDTSSNNWQWAKEEYSLPGFGTISNPYIIESKTINGEGISVACIEIRNSNQYFIIRNSFLSDSFYGLKLYKTDNGKIEGNWIMSCDYGIFTIYSDNNIISENWIYFNDHDGMFISGSDHNIISDNTVHSNGDGGIYLGQSHSNQIIDNNEIYNNKKEGIRTINSNNNHIMENTIYDNNIGISIEGSDSTLSCIYLNNVNDNTIGIYLYQSNNFWILANELNSNWWIGIAILECNSIYAVYNTISDSGCGIALLGCVSCAQSGNTFINCNNDVIEA